MIATAQIPSVVYFILSPRMKAVKIGHTKSSVKSRMSSMATGNADYLVFVGWREGTEHDERAIHDKFKNHHLRGEWFALTDELRNYICECNHDADGLEICNQILAGQDPDLEAFMARQAKPLPDLTPSEGTLLAVMREEIRKSGLSANALAKATKVDQTTISDFIRGSADLRLATASKIADYLGLKLR